MAAQSSDADVAASAVKAALKDSNWLIVSEAAKLVVQLSLRDLASELLEVWPRFCKNAVKCDPGCRAKEAALTALDHSEWLDPDPFLAAVRYQQFEPALGGKMDTAGGLRVRALLALFRMTHSQAALYAGELMADSDPQVRAGVARGIGHYEDRNSMGLLAFKLRAADADPMVLLECASALLATDLVYGLGLLTPCLAARDEVMRETAALALGQNRDGRSIQVLLDWLESGAVDRDHDLGIRALGLSRHELARRYLLNIVEKGSLSHARAAVEALCVHRYDPQLSKLVIDAATQRGDLSLQQFVARAFQFEKD
jgi:hypothetical protein